jgi:hypothetical protein
MLTREVPTDLARVAPELVAVTASMTATTTPTNASATVAAIPRTPLRRVQPSSFPCEPLDVPRPRRWTLRGHIGIAKRYVHWLA